MTGQPQLAVLDVADPPERWQALGFEVEAAVCELGGVRIRLGASGEGITSWAVHGIEVRGDVDGLDTAIAPLPPTPRPLNHPNGATALDHLVVTTPDFDRTTRALEQAGMPLRRIRDAGGFRQGFRRLGPAILELVENKAAPPEDPARFWGLVVIVSDLDVLADRLGTDLGRSKPAVQLGRRIATLRASAGLSPRVAFMTPEAAPAEAAPHTTPAERAPGRAR